MEVATAPFVSRYEAFERVGSTNDVVRSWLADGTPEVCVATAEQQTAGRGRSGRSWDAPAGAAILVSLGFRPDWLRPEHAWRLAACVSLAMADAAEREAELPAGTIRLKWPNDLVAVVDRPGPDGRERVLKLGGVLGEGTGLGSGESTIVVGIGVNAAWHPDRFPPELRDRMTSLHEVTGGMPVDRGRLMADFLAHVAVRVEDRLRQGEFDTGEWAARQITTRRTVALETDEGLTLVPAVGVDPESGALLVGEPGSERAVLVGDVRHVRLGTA